MNVNLHGVKSDIKLAIGQKRGVLYRNIEPMSKSQGITVIHFFQVVDKSLSNPSK